MYWIIMRADQPYHPAVGTVVHAQNPNRLERQGQQEQVAIREQLEPPESDQH
jgi:hypothetical protein